MNPVGRPRGRPPKFKPTSQPKPQKQSPKGRPQQGHRRGPDGLTPGERKLVRAYVENGGNGRRACLAAYNVSSPQIADTVGAEVLGRPRVKQAVAEAYRRRNSGVQHAIGRVVDALDAEKRVFSGGGVGEMYIDPDHTTRLKAADLTFKLLDAYPQQDQQVSGTTNYISASVLVAETDTVLAWIRDHGRTPTDTEREQIESGIMRDKP